MAVIPLMDCRVIGIEVARKIHCRKRAAYSGRGHTGIARELRRNRSKNGYRAQTKAIFS